MHYFLIAASALLVLAGVTVLVFYVFATVLLKKNFRRMDFEANTESISYEDIKDRFPREEFTFKSKKNALSAYLYRAGSGDDLVVYVHGMCPGHQAYLSDIISLLQRGFSVFTYDFTGTGSSEGDGYCGINQQFFDLPCAVEFLRSKDQFGFKDVFLYGHSMGGYAVACCRDSIFSSVVSISGFDSPVKELVSAFATGKSKFFKLLAELMIRVKYFIDQGPVYDLKAHEVLKDTDLYTLVIHGSEDELVPFEDISVVSKKDLINNQKVEYLALTEPPHTGHNSVIASDECIKYQKEKMEIFNNALKEYNDRQKAREIMLSDFDVFKFNAANEDLMDTVDKFFRTHRKSGGGSGDA